MAKKFIISIIVRTIISLILLILFSAIDEKVSAKAEGVTVSNNRIRFTNHPKQLYVAVRGSTVELPCSALDEESGGGKIENVWKLSDGNTILQAESNGSLVLRDVELENEGIYQCVILSPHSGVLLSGRAKLVVAKPPVFTREPQDLQAYLGSVIELQCAATGVPPASISWFHNGLPLRDDIQRFITLRSGILQIFDVQTSDQGSYFCLASNAAGNVSSRVANLTTSANLTPSESRLRFLKTPQNVSVSLGGIALLECSSERADVEFSWERADDGRFPTNVRAQKRGSYLEIRDIDVADEGWYACVGKLLSKEVLRSTAYLNVNFAPILRDFPQELVKNRGDKARFSCQVSGKPRPDIVWFRDGEEITKRGRFKIVPESTEPPDRVRKENGDIEYKRDLIVSSLRELEDNGMYQCVATNSYGETSGAAVLIITPSHKEEDGPVNFKAVTSQTSDVIQLSWEISSSLVNNDDLKAFLVHFYSSDPNSGDTTENTRAFTREEACGDGLLCKVDCCENTHFDSFTDYVFWISAIMSPTHYLPPSNEVEITTSDAVSAGVALLEIEDSNSEGVVELKWIDPEKFILRGQTQEYRIQYGESEENQEDIKEIYQPFLIKERSIVGLKPNTVYFFRVLPKTRAGYPLEEALTILKDYPWIKHRTKVISSAANNSSSSSSSPTAHVLIKINKNRVNFRLIFQRFSNVDARECRINLTKSDEHRPLATYLVTNETNWLVTTRALEYTHYYQVSITCVVAGEIYADASSLSQIFRTPKKNNLGELSSFIREPPVPFPVNVECVPISKPKSVGVRWEQLPTASNVHHFNVRFSPKADDAEILNVSAHVSYKQISSMMIVFDDLSAGEPYLFAVQTIMRDKKTSKFSDDVTCVASLTAPSAPHNVAATTMGNNSVYVQWKTSGSKSEEKISAYYVRYKRNGIGDDGFVEFSVGGTASGTVITNLTSGDVYVITVIAENKAGRSPPSKYVAVAVLDPPTITVTPPSEIRVSYTEGIIIGVCIALIAIVICVLILHCRMRKSDNGCPVRFTTTSNDGCSKKSNDAHRGLDHCTPNRNQHREMQTLLPPLLENSECDSKGGVDDGSGRYASICIPPQTKQHHASSSIIAETPILEQKEPLVVTVESSCPDDHHEQCSDLSSHSPATGSSLQSWNTQQNVVDHLHHNHNNNNNHQHQHPAHYYNNNPRCHHHNNKRRRSSTNNGTNTNSSSSSMPNLTDSGIGIDDLSVNLLHLRPLNLCSATPTTLMNNDNNFNNVPPPRNGYYSKHLTWLKDFLMREQEKQNNEKLYGGEGETMTTTAANFNATY